LYSIKIIELLLMNTRRKMAEEFIFVTTGPAWRGFQRIRALGDFSGQIKLLQQV